MPATEASALEFWGLRPFKIVGSYPIQQWALTRNTLEEERKDRQLAKKEAFFLKHNLNASNNQHFSFLDTSQHLTFWAKFLSWSFCNSSKSLVKNTLLPSYRSRNNNRAKNDCSCSSDRYIIPTIDDIPICLRGLTNEETLVLRPFDLHTGDYLRKQHGYRQKNGFCRISWSRLSVPEKIDQITDAHSKFRCLLAFHFLMQNSESRYKVYVILICQNKDRSILTIIEKMMASSVLYGRICIQSTLGVKQDLVAIHLA